MIHVQLGQIAEIRTGYTLRQGLDKADTGETPIVQMSDFEALREGHIEKVNTTNMRIRYPEWVLQEEDLLMKGRGNDLVPIVIHKVFQGALFTHPLLRMRINRELALPGYIAWVLSLSHIQSQLQRLTAGTLLQMLKIDHLKGLELSLPSLDRQHKIQEIVQLMNQEQKLLSHIKTKRKQLVSCSIEKLLHEESMGSAKIIGV